MPFKDWLGALIYVAIAAAAIAGAGLVIDALGGTASAALGLGVPRWP